MDKKFDVMDEKSFKVEQTDADARLKKLHQEFKSKVMPLDKNYENIDDGIDRNLSRILGVNDVSAVHPTLMDETKRMMYGVESDGFKTRGLEDLSKWKLDKKSPYYEQNLNQQSGFAAEILSTYKENLAAKANGSDIRTYRADDLPNLFQGNDPYVDKVRMNDNGEIIERIQTKFVGGDGKQWVSKMMSSKFEKYLDGEHVDKIECPKEFYDEIKTEIPKRVTKLEKQLEHVTANGKQDAAVKIQHNIDKLNRLDDMVEQSNTTRGEARYARLHPQSTVDKIFKPELTKLSKAEGLKDGAFAAGITFTMSAVDNISSYMDGEITAEEMVKDITTKTASAGALGYGAGFISRAVGETMKTSSHQLIQKVGGSSLPGATVSFAVESYDSISDFAQGEITGGELAYDLGENAAMIAGGIEGAKIGATLGSPAGPVGSAAGGIVGGLVGCAVTSEVYKTAVEAGAENAEKIGKKAQEFADSTVKKVAKAVPEKLDDVKGAFNDFAGSVKLPIHV